MQAFVDAAGQVLDAVTGRGVANEVQVTGCTCPGWRSRLKSEGAQQ